MGDWPGGMPPFLARVEGGEFEGWYTLVDAPNFAQFAGPFYFSFDDEDNAPVAAMALAAHHQNLGGTGHGGALMTFVDMAAFHTITPEVPDWKAVTVGVSCDFVGAGPIGGVLRCKGEILRAGGRSLFTRGLVTAAGAPVLNWSAHLMRMPTKGRG